MLNKLFLKKILVIIQKKGDTAKNRKNLVKRFYEIIETNEKFTQLREGDARECLKFVSDAFVSEGRTAISKAYHDFIVKSKGKNSEPINLNLFYESHGKRSVITEAYGRKIYEQYIRFNFFK